MKKQLKLGGIGKHNQYRQTDLKYDPLRRLVQNRPSNTYVNTQYFVTEETIANDNDMIQSKISLLENGDISRISKVSGRLKSLSRHDAQIITKISYIPLNCHLTETNKQEIRQRALSQKYRAVSIEQKRNLKPVTPKTFQNLQRNISQRRIVYVYDCNDKREYGIVQQVKIDQKDKIKQVISQYEIANSKNLIESGKKQRISNENASLNDPNFVNVTNSSGGITKNNSNNYKQFQKKGSQTQNIGIQASSKGLDNIKNNSNKINQSSKKGSQVSSKGEKQKGIIITKNSVKQKDSPISKVQEVDNKKDFNDFETPNKANDKRKTILNGQKEEGINGKNREGMTSPQNKNIIQHSSKLISYLPSQTSIQSPTKSGRVNNHVSTLNERQARLSEYQQQTGSPGYNFKKYQESDRVSKSKKSPYKYNIYSALDQQANLKCATGMCMPNQLCASSAKLDNWK